MHLNLTKPRYVTYFLSCGNSTKGRFKIEKAKTELLSPTSDHVKSKLTELEGFICCLKYLHFKEELQLWDSIMENCVIQKWLHFYEQRNETSIIEWSWICIFFSASFKMAEIQNPSLRSMDAQERKWDTSISCKWAIKTHEVPLTWYM